MGLGCSTCRWMTVEPGRPLLAQPRPLFLALFLGWWNATDPAHNAVAVDVPGLRYLHLTETERSVTGGGAGGVVVGGCCSCWSATGWLSVSLDNR
jgi:hypothetical protein